jgi:hypothetical protein
MLIKKKKKNTLSLAAIQRGHVYVLMGSSIGHELRLMKWRSLVRISFHISLRKHTQKKKKKNHFYCHFHSFMRYPPNRGNE